MPRHRPDETFVRFWSAYPRRVGRATAYAAWCRLDPDDALVEVILDALNWQRAVWSQSPVRFTPHPTTYIRHRRWEDEPSIEMPHSPAVISRLTFLGGRK